MRNTFTKIIFSACVLIFPYLFSDAQSLTAINPDIAQQGQSLTTTITATGNIFTPGSPFGGYDVRMIKSGGVYEVDSDWGSVNFNNANNITAHWNIPGGAPSGMYDLYVDATDGSGSWMTHFLPSVFQIGCLVSLSETHQNTTCGNTNGSINLSPSGGTPPYTFLWSNGATTEDLGSLAQGIYSVTVTDASPCSQSIVNIIIGNTNGPAVTETHLSSTCANANGSVNINVLGGTAPYTFNWSNGTTTEDLTNILAGTYLVTVTDFNSCAGYVSSTVLDSNDLAISISSHSYNCSNQGVVIANVISGVAPYTYQWSNGATTDSIVNVPSGNYFVTVTDAGGCQQVQSLNYYFNNYIYLTHSSPNCTNNGTLTATVYGGAAPFSYLWSNGQTNQTAYGLATGSYSITTTDAAGCTRTANYNLLSATDFNLISGTLFHDLNSNCIQDSGETPIPNITVYASSGTSDWYGTTNASGVYNLHVAMAGTFTLNAWFGGNTVCGNATACNSTITFPGLCDTSLNNNFTLSNSQGFDLLLHPGWWSTGPGFEKFYRILYYNDSPTPFTDTATIVFHYDSALIYHDSLPPFPVHDIVNHTLTWQVTNVPSPIWNWAQQIPIYFHTPATLPVGYLLHYDFNITPTAADCNPSNNFLQYSVTLQGSQDPNEKQVEPAGDIMEDDSVLTYTIHFQNTGTDTTNFIVLKDTLSQYLNPASIINLASSHEYSDFNVSGNGILTWTFNPIYLVDSTTNEIESHGWVMFSLKKRDDMPVGAQIDNNASIYFDYNAPVVTNTVHSMLINSVQNISANEISVSVFPNPFSTSTQFVVNGVKGKFDFVVTNVLGETISEIKNINSKQFYFNQENLSQGIYFYSIMQNGKRMATGKLVKE